jgi:hypothetical protein
MESIVFDHTRKLIHHGIFNKLTDEQFSNLYITLLRDISSKATFDLLRLWRKADFSRSHLKYKLLSDTNLILKKYGMPILEEKYSLEEI